ncbi:hypothetical protein BAE44_0020954 [Dichanthelium oligosanthes]|uniref:SHSP domain-containing protein n=1 Tax=Dichanthelium oligosanthes TaxID=888268 RepID=A0A1E5UYV4_9POAL|nr:hypothetical protein BAE44_0020954 [Dichanthelium oligosanthes]
MASAVVAFKDDLLAGLKELPAAPSAPEKPVAPSLRLLLNTKGALSRHDDDDISEKPSGKDTADDRLALNLSVPKPFSTDALDLFGEPMNLAQLLGLMENGGAASRTGFSPRGWWVSKEDHDALQMKVAMPGLGKEHMDQIKAEMKDGVLKVTMPKIKDEERKDVFQIKVE